MAAPPPLVVPPPLREGWPQAGVQRGDPLAEPLWFLPSDDVELFLAADDRLVPKGNDLGAFHQGVGHFCEGAGDGRAALAVQGRHHRRVAGAGRRSQQPWLW